MAYFICLKYLDSLEDFRKNTHVKIPHKSPCANFQSLGICKNPIFIRKRTLLRFRPIRPSPRPCWPALPRWPLGPCSAHSAQAALAYLPIGVFPSTLRIPATTPSLSHVTAMWASPVNFIPFPCRPISLTLSLLLVASGHPAPPGLQHRDANRVAASSRCLRPPRAARPPTSRCQSKSSLTPP
jgi:hypothetical protein